MSAVTIIDGYNVLGASEHYASLRERDIDAARARLIADVSFAIPVRDEEAIVVFDGGQNPASDGAMHEVGGVGVVFSAYGRDADEVIEELASRRRGAGETVTVVTSDAETQWVALGLGARRQSSAEFAASVVARREEHDAERPAQTGRVPVESRLDAATREALARWARGGR